MMPTVRAIPRTTRRARGLAASALLAAAALSFGAQAASAQLLQKELPQTKGVQIADRRGQQVPPDLVFHDSNGKLITSKELFDGRRPVLLVMAYYTCPLLCPLVLDHVKDSLNNISWVAGDQFRVVTVSFDHRNTAEQAALKKQTYLLGYNHEVKPDAWRFLVADVDNAQGIAKAVGFHYRFLAETGEFSHPSAIFFLTPDGKVSNFIENLVFSPADVQRGLEEAAEGHTGSLFERIMLTCFMYDPERGVYKMQALATMKIGGALTAAALGVTLTALFINGRRRDRAALKAQPTAAPSDQASNFSPEPSSSDPTP